MSRIGQLLDAGQRFFRGSFFGYSALLVLLGAGSANRTASATEILALVVIAANYHLFGYVHNDLIDLPLDRTQPLRARDPLVTGRVSERQGWIFVLVQIPVSYLVAWWAGASGGALAALTLGYAATITYNVYGKRCPVPILTDAVQGLAWSSLAMVGVLMVGQPTAITCIPAGFGFGFILLINGVHGGLRDLKNDYEQGRINTAIYLGARPSTGSLVRSTRKLQVFAFLAFIVILTPPAAVIAAGLLPYHGRVLLLATTSWLVINLCSAWLLWQVVKTESAERSKMIYQHQMPLLAAPLVIMLPALGWSLQLTVLACLFGPFVLFIPRVRRFGSHRRRVASHAEHPQDE